jgi:transcriptional regulator with XRE-family HTH domain
MANKAPDATDQPQAFLAQVSECMKSKGVTQANLARRIDRSPAYVSKLLRSTNLTMTTMVKLAEALEMPLRVELGQTAANGGAERAGEQAPATAVRREALGDQEPASPLAPVLSAPASSSSPAEADLDLEEATRIADQQIEGLHPAVEKVLWAKLRKRNITVPRRPPGRPLEDDSELLDEVAELEELGEAEDWSHAVRIVAARHPGHSELATRKRLRRKYPKQENRLRTRARGRIAEQHRRKQAEQARHRRQHPARVARSSGTAGYGRLGRPLSSLSPVLEVLEELQDQFALSDPVMEQLRTPYVLEEMARLTASWPEIELAAVRSADSEMQAATRSIAENASVVEKQLPYSAEATRSVLTSRDALGALPRYPDEVHRAFARKLEEMEPLRRQLEAMRSLPGWDW